MYAGTVKWFDAQKGYGLLPATMVKETFLFTSQQLKAMALRRLMKAKRLNSKFPEALRASSSSRCKEINICNDRSSKGRHRPPLFFYYVLLYNMLSPYIWRVNVTGGTKMYTGTVKWFDAKKATGSLPAMMVKETFSFTSQQLKETDSSHWTKAIRLN